VGTLRRLGEAARAAPGAAPRSRADRLVTGDRRRLFGRREKGGAQVARSLRGRPGSRFHLAVDGAGTPLAIRLAPGNENEQRHLLPLVDELLARGLRPGELWADRGYDTEALREGLRARSIEPRISRKRPRGEPPPPQAREIWRGRRRRAKTPDPLARERWPVERTNAWLHNWRRISTRWERRAELYLALLQLACSMIICRVLDRSL
jgi:transposase